jgi:O-antigen/teichoic acid export membrane protein
MKRLWVGAFFQFTPQLVSFVTFTIITRQYDVQNVASYVYALNLFYLIMPALVPAFEQFILVNIKGSAEKEENARSVFSSTALTVLIISVLSSIVATLYLHVTSNDPEVLPVFLAFVPALLISPFTVTVQAFRARDDYSSLFRIGTSSIIAGAAVRFFLASIRADIFFIALSFCIEPLVSAVYSVFRFHATAGVFVFSRPQFSMVKTLVGLTPMLTGCMFLVMLYARAPTLALAKTVAAPELVRYGIASQLLAALSAATMSLFFVVNPPLAHLDMRSKEFARLLRALFLLSTLIAVVYVVANFTLAEFFAVRVFGSKAVGIGALATILAPIGPLQMINTLRNTLALRANCFKQHILALFIGFIFLVGMLWFTIPKYGAEGAALSITLSTFICAYPASILVPVMRSWLFDLFRCGIGLGGWRDLLDLIRQHAR